MTPLDRLRADQHDDLVLPADHARDAFLAEADIDVVRRDLEPTTAVERRHLARVRGAA